LDAIMAVNLRGVFLCCKRAIAQMVEQEPIGDVRGRVINISSQHGMVGPPGHVAYAVSKGGVVNLTRQSAVDYARRGVRVNAVAPGKI
jgi:NAD(P)-dependent dehydrogenase (short-subunit alcohol dehydrogenase family)